MSATPFGSLTTRGQTQRLARLARVALDRYGLADARISLLKHTFNTLFRVVDARGNRTALRVGARERIHTDDTEAVETAWLTALRADTNIGAPRPVADRWGAYVSQAEAPGVPEPRTCVLFEWARGRRVGEAMSVEYANATGRLLAALHEHGTQFEGGRKQPVLVGDQVLGFVLRDLVPRHDGVYGTMLAEAMARAQTAIDSLWAHPPHAPHLLHGDLHPNNILVWRGRLTPVDFQDLLWGFEIQDVSMTIMAFEYYRDRDILAAAFRSGYEEERAWPAANSELLTSLVAARHLSVLNLGFNLRRPGYDAFVARHAAWLRTWMDTR